MRRTELFFALITVIAGILVSCGSNTRANTADEAPPNSKVIQEPDLNIVNVDRPERFTVVTAGEREERPELHATGVVNPDVERSVPVISLASGRVIEIDAKLGDDVKKGQLLLKVLSNDISTGFQNYNQAKADEELSRKQLERGQLLYDHGAISLNDLQVLEDAEQKAKVAVEAAAQALRTMGADLNHQSPIVNIYAPVSGTIVEQNVVQSASVHTPDNQPNLFTVADLSRVWVIADVYENDIPIVRPGDTADVAVDAYPDRILHGRIDNIGKVLDPNIRTAKVRVVLNNPGILRAGMFVRTTFYGQHGQIHATVPAGAVLHLHDRDWVFVPRESGAFVRTEVNAGSIVNGQQDILAGISPGQKIVNDALALSAATEQ
ncbi:MAG: efflux RND transporter periplasmic adaptor subunit [Acidobacteriaceae bacterium]|nr:efflux RND transporter periplasmic adaptor subunit [Acidobacteriaceae bacterium]